MQLTLRLRKDANFPRSGGHRYNIEQANGLEWNTVKVLCITPIHATPDVAALKEFDEFVAKLKESANVLATATVTIPD